MLFHRTRGRGAPCLVLSAVGAEPYERQLLPPLPDHLQLTVVELRGSGRSEGDASSLTFESLAEDLEAVRRDLGHQQVAVLGHSILGMLAIEYGRRCPETVSHVITVGSPTHGNMAKLVEQAKAYFREVASDERRHLQQEALARLPRDPPPGAVMLAQTPSRFHDAWFDAAPLYAEAAPDRGLVPHLLGRLGPGWEVTAGPPLRVPHLHAHGTSDFIVPHTLWRDALERLPTTTLRLFEKSGHQPFFEEPAAFTAAVVDWLAATRPGASRR